MGRLEDDPDLWAWICIRAGFVRRPGQRTYPLYYSTMEEDQEGHSEPAQAQRKSTRIRMRRELFYLRLEGGWYECEQHADSVTLWEIEPEGYRGSRSLPLAEFQELAEQEDVELTTVHPFESSPSE